MRQKNVQQGIRQTMPINRKAKDTFFKKVYESEERRRKLAADLLGLKSERVSAANVRPVLFGNKENDLAFLCGDVFYIMMEEQSSVSPNIPYRMLEYIVAGLRSTVDSEQLLYGRSRVYFPVPKLYLPDWAGAAGKQTAPDAAVRHIPERVIHSGSHQK